MVENITVDRIDVAKYYLKCEIGKVARIDYQTEHFAKAFDKAIDILDQNEATRLAAVLSCHYRKNPLCERLESLIWKLENVSCNKLLMSRINSDVNPFLEQCGFNLAKFTEIIRSNVANEEKLKEFRDDGRTIWHTRVITERFMDSVQILDGSHRAAILAFRGSSEIASYVGYKS